MCILNVSRILEDSYITFPNSHESFSLIFLYFVTKNSVSLLSSLSFSVSLKCKWSTYYPFYSCDCAKPGVHAFFTVRELNLFQHTQWFHPLMRCRYAHSEVLDRLDSQWISLCCYLWGPSIAGQYASIWKSMEEGPCMVHCTCHVNMGHPASWLKNQTNQTTW